MCAPDVCEKGGAWEHREDEEEVGGLGCRGGWLASIAMQQGGAGSEMQLVEKMWVASGLAKRSELVQVANSWSILIPRIPNQV